jgi:hypothetical protein
MEMSSILPTNPFHIARAYQIGGTARSTGNGATMHTARVERSSTAGSVTPSMNVNTRRLVAGSVPGKIDFSGGVPTQSVAALPMYRNPAEKNAAATGVNAGRMIDIEG